MPKSASAAGFTGLNAEPPPFPSAAEDDTGKKTI